MILKKADENIELLKELYKKAFPENERKPFDLVLENEKKGITDILAIEDDVFKGLVITIKKNDLVLVDYFAVDESMRGQGTGAEALKLIREKYKGCRVFLEIELPGEQYDNNEQRTRRKAFYLRNGLKASGIHTKVYETDMELLIFDKPVSFEEYKDIFKLAIDEERLKIISEPELI